MSTRPSGVLGLKARRYSKARANRGVESLVEGGVSRRQSRIIGEALVAAGSGSGEVLGMGRGLSMRKRRQARPHRVRH